MHGMQNNKQQKQQFSFTLNQRLFRGSCEKQI